MTRKEIQIVTFNNPYPPNFGGAIDMFYKIKALHSLGIDVHLHIFFKEREDISGLQKFCKSIYTYRQNRFLLNQFSVIPFSNISRNSKLLEERLTASKAPIFFESLRTVLPLKRISFEQKVAVRCHNIEHDYSFGLANSERNLINKASQYFEGLKQKYFESVLNKADVLFNISNYEQSYFSKKYNANSVLLPVFQGNSKFIANDGYGEYALYHGDLSTADNLKSVSFLIKVFKSTDVPFVIASSFIPKSIQSLINNNISFVKIESNKHLQDLIENAHVNTLYSFQRSGTKLKVFNALYNGKHCILNRNMVDDQDILNICEVEETEKNYRKIVLQLFKKEYKLTEEKKAALSKYNDLENAKIIVKNLL